MKGIDGKILQLKEMGFIEKQLLNTLLNPDKFYSDLSGFFKDNYDLAHKSVFDIHDLSRIDRFVESYFLKSITESEMWLLRAYIVGRYLAVTDLTGTIFNISSVASLPQHVIQAAQEYNLTLQQARSLEYAIIESASEITNTTQATIQTVRNALNSSVKQRGSAVGILDELKELITKDAGEINRDWRRVAIYEANALFNNGYLATLNEGDYVVGLSMPDACKSCIELISGKVYRVRKSAPEDYQKYPVGSEKYQEIAEIWENEVWVGKNNIGRSSSRQKRIDPEKGNTKENLTEKHHHEHAMPTAPMHPSCFPGEVEIYTKKGWQRFDELERGVEVATFNLDSCEMEYQMPDAYISHVHSGEMIQFKGKNIDITMTPEHNIITGVRDDRKNRIVTGYKLVSAEKAKSSIIPISCKYNNYTAKSIKIGGHTIDETTYAKLMGYYLSEGSCKSKKYGWEVKISQEKEQSNKKIYEDLKPLNVTLRKYSHSIQFNDKDLCEYLMQFNHQPERFIPEDIKELSKEGLMSFIDAYLLGDGSVSKPKMTLSKQKTPSFAKVIFTSSKQIADDFTEILLKAGYSVSYKLLRTKGKEQKFKNGTYTINHDTWVVSIKNSKHVSVFEKIYTEFTGNVYCVSVPNETILVRSNGKVLFIGNCRCRWIYFNPQYQWIDEDKQIRLRVEDEEGWRKWYENNIGEVK